MSHLPVLLKEVIECLNPQANQNFIDCTIGGGWHALAILQEIEPNGKLLGIDLWKRTILKLARFKNKNKKIKKRLILVCDNFANLKEIVKKYKFFPVHGVFLDLGLSTDLLEKSGKGFSFQKNEFLDMRFGAECQNLTAAQIINTWSKEKIEGILRQYGEEKFARRIVQEIVKTRKTKPIKFTSELVEAIKRATPLWYHHKRIHFATRTFQALRVAVNNELENLKKVLPQVTDLLIKGGRVAVISYHSLEDCIVKQYFKKEERLKILFKKPIKPSFNEQLKNPRSRSAKLRVGEKI